MQKYLIPVGGFLAGGGLMTMLWGWETKGGADMATQISTIGFTGVEELVLTSNGALAFALIFSGIALMVWGNATAWKQTNGY